MKPNKHVTRYCESEAESLFPYLVNHFTFWVFIPLLFASLWTDFVKGVSGYKSSTLVDRQCCPCDHFLVINSGCNTLANAAEFKPPIQLHSAPPNYILWEYQPLEYQPLEYQPLEYQPLECSVGSTMWIFPLKERTKYLISTKRNIKFSYHSKFNKITVEYCTNVLSSWENVGVVCHPDTKLVVKLCEKSTRVQKCCLTRYILNQKTWTCTPSPIENDVFQYHAEDGTKQSLPEDVPIPQKSPTCSWRELRTEFLLLQNGSLSDIKYNITYSGYTFCIDIFAIHVEGAAASLCEKPEDCPTCEEMKLQSAGRQCCPEHHVYDNEDGCTPDTNYSGVDFSPQVCEISTRLLKHCERGYAVDLATLSCAPYSEDIEIRHFYSESVEKVSAHISSLCREKPEHDYVRLCVLGSGFLVSAFCLLIVIVCHIFLPKLRDIQGYLIISHTLSLLLGTLANFIGEIFKHLIDRNTCTIIGFVRHYFTLSVAFWLSAMCYDIWRLIRETLKAIPISNMQEEDWKRFKVYCVIAWGAPLLVSIITIVLELVPESPYIRKPNLGVENCNFKGYYEVLAYQCSIMIVLFIVNILMLGYTTFLLYKVGVAFKCWTKPVVESTSNLKHVDRFWLRFCLFMVRAILSILHILQYHTDGHEIVKIIFQSMGSLEGLYVSVIFITNTRNRNLVKGCLPCFAPIVPSSLRRPNKSSPRRGQRTTQSQRQLDGIAHYVEPPPHLRELHTEFIVIQNKKIIGYKARIYHIY